MLMKSLCILSQLKVTLRLSDTLFFPCTKFMNNGTLRGVLVLQMTANEIKSNGFIHVRVPVYVSTI